MVKVVGGALGLLLSLRQRCIAPKVLVVRDQLRIVAGVVVVLHVRLLLQHLRRLMLQGVVLFVVVVHALGYVFLLLLYLVHLLDDEARLELWNVSLGDEAGELGLRRTKLFLWISVVTTPDRVKRAFESL